MSQTTSAKRKTDSVLASMMRRPTAVIGMVAIVVLIIFALMPVSWLPFDPRVPELGLRFAKPFFLEGGAPGHLLGTDSLGRDILSMLIAGTRYTMMIVLSAAVIGLVLGVAAGLFAGYSNGRTSSLIMRLADVQLAFPTLILLIAVTTAFGPNLRNLILILGITSWAPYARLVRSTVLSLKEKDYIEAARATGLRDTAIVLRHLLPNAMTTIIVFATYELARLILVESALSYLGVGIQPPNPSWGSMIANSQPYLYEAWWASFLPGMMIVVAALAFSLVGDELRDILDRKQ